MKEVTVDCAGISDRRQFHDVLAEALEFPGWYGRNLDALYDCLTDLGETVLILENSADLGPFGIAFLETIRDAERKNPRLRVTLL